MDVKKSIRPPSSLVVVPFGEMKEGSILGIGINFHANHEKKFNVEVSLFDENLYTLQSWTLKTLSTKDVLEAERVAMGKLRAEVYRMCC